MCLCMCPNIRGEKCNKLYWNQCINTDGTFTDIFKQSLKVDFDKMCSGCTKQF